MTGKTATTRGKVNVGEFRPRGHAVFELVMLLNPMILKDDFVIGVHVSLEPRLS